MNLVNTCFLIVMLRIITDNSFVPAKITANCVILVHSMIVNTNNLEYFTIENFITVAIGNFTIILNHMVGMKPHSKMYLVENLTDRLFLFLLEDYFLTINNFKNFDSNTFLHRKSYH